MVCDTKCLICSNCNSGFPGDLDWFVNRLDKSHAGQLFNVIPLSNPDSTTSSLLDQVEKYFSDNDIYENHPWEVVESDDYGVLFYLGQELFLKIMDPDNPVEFIDYDHIYDYDEEDDIKLANEFSWPARYMQMVDNGDQIPVTEYISRLTFPIADMSTLAYTDPKSDEYYTVALDYAHQFIVAAQDFFDLFDYDIFVMPVFRVETTGEWFVDLEVNIQLSDQHDTVLLYNFVDNKLSKFIKESGQTTGEVKIASLDTYTETYNNLFADFEVKLTEYFKQKDPLTFNAIPLHNPDASVSSLSSRVEQYFLDEEINQDFTWEVAEVDNHGVLFYLGENLFSKVMDTRVDFIDYILISEYTQEPEFEKLFSWPARYMYLVDSEDQASVTEYTARFTFPVDAMSTLAYTDPASDEYYAVALDYAFQLTSVIEDFVEFIDYEVFVMPVFKVEAGDWYVDLEVNIQLSEEHDTLLLYNFVDYKLTRFIKQSGQTTGKIQTFTLDKYTALYDKLFANFAIKLDEYIKQKELVTTTPEPTLEPTTNAPTTKEPTTKAPTTKAPTT